MNPVSIYLEVLQLASVVISLITAEPAAPPVNPEQPPVQTTQVEE